MNDNVSISETPPLKTVIKALAVLRAFEHKYEWRLADLATYLGQHKSVTHRLVSTLADQGFLQRTSERGTYVLGAALMALARTGASMATVSTKARPHLIKLAERTREVVTLDVLRGHRYVCTELIDITSHVRTIVQVGDTIGLHAGAGKTILAYQSDSFIDEVLREPLVRYTQATLCDPREVRAALQLIRDRGYWVSRGEITPGTQGLSVPVRNQDGSVTSTLVVTTSEGKRNDQGQLVQDLQDTATAISRDLGYKQITDVGIG